MAVGKRASIVRIRGSDSGIGEDVAVRPLTYICPNTKLGVGAKLGGFAETKSMQVGNDSKIPYLTYAGDAETGEYSSISAPGVFMNHDGVSKHRTVTGLHVRIDPDTMFIVPVTVSDNVYSSTGIIIKDSVPPGVLAVSGGRQCNTEGWVEWRHPGTTVAETV